MSPGHPSCQLDSLSKHSELPLGVGHRARAWGHDETSGADTPELEDEGILEARLPG